ncbi:MAG: hypothetical protein ACOX4K_11215 [Bacillota bacterium]
MLILDNVLFQELLKFPGLSDSDKAVYLRIHMFRPQSMEELIAGAALARNTVSRSCNRLEKAGWLKWAEKGQRRIPIPIVPVPVQTVQAKMIEFRFNLANHKGEFLSKEYLYALVRQRNYIDNARPNFLIYPLTGEPLELDRYFPEEKVGSEYNGLQHYGPTEKYPDHEEFKQRRVRDLFKIGACAENGVILVVLTARDLTLSRMVEKIPARLSKNEVAPEGPVIHTLERLSRQYRTQIERIEKKLNSRNHFSRR